MTAVPMQRDLSYVNEYHYVWQLVEDNYLESKKLTNWQKFEHSFDKKLRSEAELTTAIDSMLDSLHDPFTWRRESDENADSDDGTKMAQAQDIGVSAYARDNIGYVRINSFHDCDVDENTEAALRSLPPVNAYVLDLRNNHGGLIDKAFSTFSLFCDEGKFVTLFGRKKDKRDVETLALNRDQLVWKKDLNERLDDRRPNLTSGKPLVIIVNSDTRSAAEVLAGSLRQSRGAIIIGEHTYGKGVAQDVYELNNGSAVKIVTAWMELPHGERFHGTGLQPDKPIGKNDEWSVATSVLHSTSGKTLSNPKLACHTL